MHSDELCKTVPAKFSDQVGDHVAVGAGVAVGMIDGVTVGLGVVVGDRLGWQV